MSNFQVLYLEDDPEMKSLICACLPRGSQCDAVSTLTEARKLLSENSYHLILVDLILENESGFDFLKDLREKEFDFIPIVMVITASDSEMDEVKCHNADVDEFIRKPVRAQALRSQLEKRLRRFTEKDDQSRVGPFVVDKRRMEVQIHDGSHARALALTLKEYKLLLKFLNNPGTAITREEIFVEVWQGSSEMQSRTIDMHVSALRKKLGEHASIITSVRGVGYMFMPA